MLRERENHRGDQVRKRDLVLLNELQHFDQVEFGHYDERYAFHKWGEDESREAVNVEEGEKPEGDVMRVELHNRDGAAHRLDEV